VFMDLDSIEPGLDFVEVIERAVGSCAVLVVLMGRQWATLADEGGQRRLDDPDDFVRSEVQTALERGVRVIPVLVDRAKPPQRQGLPAELHQLARLNAFDLSYDRFQYDAGRLLNLIQQELAAAGEVAQAGRKIRGETTRQAREVADHLAPQETDDLASQENGPLGGEGNAAETHDQVVRVSLVPGGELGTSSAAPTDQALADEFTAMNPYDAVNESRDRSVAATRLRGKMETGDYDVFLCYNSKDKSRVIAIGERLKERGILPWLDIWEIRPGSRWQKELQRNIKSIKSVAVFIGGRGAGPWQDLEVESLLQQFVKRKRPIIPVILEGRSGTPRLPTFLSSWHIVDMRQPEPDPFNQLVWGITGEKAAHP
jgi:TIR domain